MESRDLPLNSSRDCGRLQDLLLSGLNVCQSPTGPCTGAFLALDNFALKAHSYTQLERVLTTPERAPFRRDNVNFPVRTFQSQTGKCFRSGDVTQVCSYRLKSGDWQLPPVPCGSTVVFSGP